MSTNSVMNHENRWMEDWPRPILYNVRENLLFNAKRFLSGRPYEILSSDGVLYSLVDNVWRAMTKEEIAAEIHSTNPLLILDVGNIHGVVRAIHLDRYTAARPFEWIKQPDNAPHPNNLVLFGNGILNLETQKLLPLNGDYFATGVPDFDFDPDATCPLWVEKLHEWLHVSFHDTLQEFFGYVMTPDTSMEKMLALVGVPRGGKSTVMRVMGWLVGSAHADSRTLHDLAGDFGLQGCLDKRVLFIPDASDTEQNKRSVALNRIKSVTGNDVMSVNRKNLPIVSAKLPARLVLSGNKHPKFLDESGALAARELLIVFENTFANRMDLQLSDKLRNELPGIANWALRGLQRARDLGHFSVGQRGMAAVRALAESQSPALRFATARLSITGNPNDYVSLPEVYDAYDQWASYSEKLTGRERRNRDDFKNDLVAALMSKGVRYTRKRRRDPGKTRGNGKPTRGFFGFQMKPRV